MTKPATTSPTRHENHTICLPITEEHYCQIIAHPKEFRVWLDQCYQDHLELFPSEMSQGYENHTICLPITEEYYCQIFADEQ